jgi:hypothetical protein
MMTHLSQGSSEAKAGDAERHEGILKVLGPGLGDSLGTLVRRKFARTGRIVIGTLIVALLVANCLNVAADLAAIGSGMELMHLGPGHLWAAVAGVGLTAATVLGSFDRIAALFKWLALVLVVYVAVLFVAHVPEHGGRCGEGAGAGCGTGSVGRIRARLHRHRRHRRPRARQFWFDSAGRAA